MRYEIQPIGNWTDPVTRSRPYCRFRAPWADTLDLLGKETAQLGATLVVLQVDVTAGDLRRDGMLRANARVGFPGIRVSLDSRYGPLTYATDRFDWWQDNVRAVALSLQALRAVDRYGVTKRGEQYAGWLALPTGVDDVVTAQALIDSYGGEREAVKATHPDRGGDQAAFLAVQHAREVLAGASS